MARNKFNCFDIHTKLTRNTDIEILKIMVNNMIQKNLH